MSARPWGAEVSCNPNTIIVLSRFKPLLTEFFHLDDDAIHPHAPFMWWDRSKRGVGIGVPLPPPIAFSDGKGRGPLFTQEQVIHWYGMWKGLNVPTYVGVGDRVSDDGAITPSNLRSRSDTDAVL